MAKEKAKTKAKTVRKPVKKAKPGKGKLPDFFANAFYESKFRDNLFVIKASGDVIEDSKALDSLMGDIRRLSMIGIKILLIYGGGKAMDKESEKRGLEIVKHKGRRVTDKNALAVMRHVVGGDLSLNVYQAMARSGLEGLSFNAVPADWLDVVMRPKKPIDFGYVGDIVKAHARPALRLFRGGTDFMACACLCVSEDGALVNVNADTIATELSIALKADKLIFLSNVDGVLIEDKTAFCITTKDIPALIKNGTVTGGMQVKLENCARALEAGVRRIHLINGLRKNALAGEIFEPIGPGTMILRESEKENYMNEIEIQKAIGGKTL